MTADDAEAPVDGETDDATVGPFDPPPIAFRDGTGREIVVEVLGADPAELDALVTMYEEFDTADRAQGLPPVGEGPIREWLATLLDESDSCNVVARDGETVVGHATLVADGDDHELAIFVHQGYQGAGIGTRLMRALLGHGGECGVEDVWLTVERWNRAAVALYEKIGFEREGRENFTIEMAARMAAPSDRRPDGRDASDR